MNPAVQLTAVIQSNEHSRWTAVRDSSVVLCGGLDTEGRTLGWRTAYQVYKDGQVTVLPDMHGKSGVLHWQGSVHVFGSADPAASANAYLFRQLRDGKCCLCSDRFDFTPAVIYLCGGFQNSSVEIFDGRGFRKLGLRLSEAGTAVEWIQGDCLATT